MSMKRREHNERKGLPPRCKERTGNCDVTTPFAHCIENYNLIWGGETAELLCYFVCLAIKLLHITFRRARLVFQQTVNHGLIWNYVWLAFALSLACGSRGLVFMCYLTYFEVFKYKIIESKKNVHGNVGAVFKMCARLLLHMKFGWLVCTTMYLPTYRTPTLLKSRFSMSRRCTLCSGCVRVESILTCFRVSKREANKKKTVSSAWNNNTILAG